MGTSQKHISKDDITYTTGITYLFDCNIVDFLDISAGGSAQLTWLCSSIRLSVHNSRSQDWLISFF